MSDYQVIARKFRPKTFKDVVGQEAIVTTLKNAIKFNRLAHAYLFCGSRGTGKTTLARLFAKALNCLHLTEELEPCNQCSSCKEIASSSSLDVLEIDGASNRGIEDIRQINETVGYATAAGHYKIYIIDEVHMLTKEAFNALLKTLEEPPPKVKFFFATTEPHKVLPTILSRCQRFNLSRIPQPLILGKLRRIAGELNVTVDEEALHLLAQRAEGGLRDAESLFDQILAFEEGAVTAASVRAILGLMPRDCYFEIDRAGKEGRFIKAFEIAQQVFAEGKDIAYFIEGLVDHLRLILLIKTAGIHSSLLSITEVEKEMYGAAANLYTHEQCLDLIEYLIEAQQQLRTTPFGKISLETVLLHVMQSHFRLPIELLVRRLSELEHLIGEKTERPIENAQPAPSPKPVSAPPPPQPPAKLISAPPPPQLPAKPAPVSLVSIDPTPSAADLGKKTKPVELAPSPAASPKAPSEGQKPQHVYDTLLQFAAIELEGKLQKN